MASAVFTLVALLVAILGVALIQMVLPSVDPIMRGASRSADKTLLIVVAAIGSVLLVDGVLLFLDSMDSTLGAGAPLLGVLCAVGVVLGLRSGWRQLTAVAGLYGAVALLFLFLQGHPIPLPGAETEGGKLGEGRRVFKELVESAWAAEADGRYEDAAANWVKVRRIDPRQSILALFHGIALLKVGRTLASEEALEKALATKADPGQSAILPRIHHWLGRVALARGDLMSACEHLRCQQQLLGGSGSSREEEDPAEFLHDLPDCTVELRECGR